MPGCMSSSGPSTTFIQTDLLQKKEPAESRGDSSEESEERADSPAHVSSLQIPNKPSPALPLTSPSPSPRVSTALFFQYNTALVPPYNILVDTNFLSHTVGAKLDLLNAAMDCLYAKCIPIITDCVVIYDSLF